MDQIKIDPMAVLDAAQGAAFYASEQQAREIGQLRAALRALLAAAERADGAERPNRPERGPGYSDAEWELFLRGWDAHAQAVYESGLRKALVRLGGGQ